MTILASAGTEIAAETKRRDGKLRSTHTKKFDIKSSIEVANTNYLAVADVRTVRPTA